MDLVGRLHRTEPAEPRSATTINALVHLYRAEVGRLTTYRVRLDTTTNWAITASVLVSTFALGNSPIPHEAFLFLMLVDAFFLHVEARRYQAYELSRYRVQLLERCFYPEVLGAEVDPYWTGYLLDALRRPRLPVSIVGAMGWRLRRNYLWIFVAVLVAWSGKLILAGQPAGPLDVQALAALGPIPGWVTVGVVGVLYAGLLTLAVLAPRVYPEGGEEAQYPFEPLPEG